MIAGLKDRPKAGAMRRRTYDYPILLPYDDRKHLSLEEVEGLRTADREQTK